MKTVIALIVMMSSSVAFAQGNILAVSWTGTSTLIDSSTGSGAALGSTGSSSLNSLAYHPSTGLFYTASGGTLYTVSPTSGAATNTGVALTVSDVRGLAITPAGICYAIVNATPDMLYSVNLANGAATLVGSTGSGSLQALAADATGALFGWAVNPSVAGTGTLMSVSTTTGVATTIGQAPASIQALAFGPNGVLWGANTTLYTISTTTGGVTAVGAGGLGDVRGIEFVNQTPPSVSFVPASAQLSPGGTLSVLYNAPGHGGEIFAPVVSCTLGALSAPFLPQPLGIAWDACTDLYFNDPAGLALLPLSGLPGSYLGILDAAGTSSGSAVAPASFPPGLNIPIHVTFVSWNTAYVYSVFGVGTFVLN